MQCIHGIIATQIPGLLYVGHKIVVIMHLYAMIVTGDIYNLSFSFNSKISKYIIYIRSALYINIIRKIRGKDL